MTRKNYQGPVPKNLDLVDQVLVGQKETNKLTKMHQKERKPGAKIEKLTRIAELTTCIKTQEKAKKAIVLLGMLPQDVVLSDSVGTDILKKISA